jgi:hypothetical protein
MQTGEASCLSVGKIPATVKEVRRRVLRQYGGCLVVPNHEAEQAKTGSVESSPGLRNRDYISSPLSNGTGEAAVYSFSNVTLAVRLCVASPK